MQISINRDEFLSLAVLVLPHNDIMVLHGIRQDYPLVLGPTPGHPNHISRVCKFIKLLYRDIGYLIFCVV